MLAMHWLVVFFAYNGDIPEPGFNEGTYLLFYLMIVDVLPLFLMNALASPLSQVFTEQTTMYISFAAIIVLASLQWLLIGSLAQFFVKEHFSSDENGKTLVS